MKIRKIEKPGFQALAVVLTVYQLKENLCKPIDNIDGDSSTELINRKIMLRETSFSRLDAEAAELGLSRAEYLRSILQWYWHDQEFQLVLATVKDLEEKMDDLQEYVRPETDEEYREAGRLLRAVRNHVTRLEEGVTDADH